MHFPTFNILQLSPAATLPVVPLASFNTKLKKKNKGKKKSEPLVCIMVFFWGNFIFILFFEMEKI
jgi:hypothetical protein